MIIGDPSTFAIESGISRAYEGLGFRALGFFVLHILGERYGVYAPDASMLACSLGEVEDRLLRRGSHIAPFAASIDGGMLADAFRDAIYAPSQEGASYFGMPRSEFSNHLYSKHLVWAPDGDEAFDDGSFVLHIDVGDQVRLIGFRSGDSYHHDVKTLRDVWLPAADFYKILEQWRADFIAEWRKSTKAPEEGHHHPNKVPESTPMSGPSATDAPGTGTAHY